MPEALTIIWLRTLPLCHHWCHLETCSSWTINSSQDRQKRLHLVFCAALSERGPGKENHWVSISQTAETTGHANSSPQTVNNAHSSDLPPPPHLCGSATKIDGDMSLAAFVATIKAFLKSKDNPKILKGKNLTDTKTNTCGEKRGNK